MGRKKRKLQFIFAPLQVLSWSLPPSPTPPSKKRDGVKNLSCGDENCVSATCGGKEIEPVV